MVVVNHKGIMAIESGISVDALKAAFADCIAAIKVWLKKY